MKDPNAKVITVRKYAHQRLQERRPLGVSMGDFATEVIRRGSVGLTEADLEEFKSGTNIQLHIDGGLVDDVKKFVSDRAIYRPKLPDIFSTLILRGLAT